ncbi:MAG: VOC family protein [Gemmatimonadales bacterium]
MSRIQTSPYVNFQGRAREAMEFYHRVLGGKLDLWAVSDRGEARAAGNGDRIAHARLEADGAVIVGSDGHPDYPAKVGENIGLALGGSDKDRLTRLFNGLAEGGRIQAPLARQPWGGEAGWMVDRFGINWTVTVNQP